ncbi:hypothetical protein [Comamonas sp. JUb58]|uniref:hypothetical protein n=1 Tax=Comamonas sp. JUb58 TaxID=2485114 RepID=UPI00105BEB41|nr:hypothetical protein [Comamonas sp. JUb58]TDS70415.1 hypothetical protein EDF71_1313 [Comamonas sp. JUb58]
MTRRTLNANGTLTLNSLSYWGDGDADEAFRQEVTTLEEHNRQALTIWDSLTPEERELRTLDFKTKQAERKAVMQADLQIPSHLLGKIVEDESPETGPTFI